MSNNKKQQRQKKSNERIIPIEIEDSDSRPDNLNDSTETGTTSTSVTDVNELLNSSASTDVAEDADISSYVEKIEIADSAGSGTGSEQEIEIKISERMVPPYNVPERIIIILDRAEDEESTYFELTNGTKLKPLNMLKDALKLFVNSKSTFDSKHEFALMTLNENSCTWVSDFTNNAQSIINDIISVEECQAEDIFDMTAVFDMINKMIKIPMPNADLIIPPPFIVRAIFLYSRSITMPQVTFTEEISNLLESPYFTFDVAMTHEIPDSSNKCNLIFKELQQFDRKGFAYFFPISRNANMLYVAMAKLLSHPLQRCAQIDANYKL